MELAQLMYAGDIRALKQHIQQNPSIVNQLDQRGFTPLILATYLDKKDIAELLLENGADINAQDAAGNTALMGVSFKGNAILTRMLIEKGADINVKNNEGDTALEFAQKHSKSEIVEILSQTATVNQ